MNHLALIALGGNLGNVEVNFNTACTMLKATCHILKYSKLYQTPAIGPLMHGKPQPDYLNAVIQLQTSLAPADLLQELHRIEDRHHRKRIQHWGARTLDLDLLTYEQTISHDKTLTLPHPRISERLFVLQPLADIDSQWKHPISGLTCLAMIQALQSRSLPLFQGRLWPSTSKP